MQIAINISEHDKSLIERHYAGEGYKRLPGAVTEAVMCAVRAGKPIEERIKAHWIRTGDYLQAAYGSVDYVRCSHCNEDSLEEGDFCPHCGADMREGE